MSKTVAFFGLGHMGGPMAANLVKAGFKVKGFDPVAALQDIATSRGIGKASSPVEAVAGADYVLSMLPNGEDVEALYIDREKLLDHIADTTLVIDCSTVAASSSRRLITEAQLRGLNAIEAPVSGGVAGAAAGTLSFMCGGDAANVERAREVLQHMGSNVFHAGPAGAGQTAKMCNNMLLAIHMIGTAEALQLGVDNGLDPKVLSEIMLKSSGANWSLEKYNPYPGVMESVPASNNYEGGFMVKLMCKDLGLAQQAATASRSYTPLGSLARNLYGLHSLAGNEELDFSSIQKLIGK
ncbi:3-hydroxyisobutyrate dehydrogenase [Microbulbifer donghaiensis]|uniref:3-hydroxyisobutyrate dehydrogenase n=1 Tax=Microbulbifer donghaiensis TaxID=494016 RepID=A0A1M5FAR3_9GAMM|nr:3-hydroxyisobutyrate dehydrogenase [Microbulbifer donghaiensis]SHF88624.1 3-hydroxyisobutyrate dehydrogenase [Microbulbifer donghaiensis]